LIDQIRHLQSAKPFATFALELTSGRVVQIYDSHHVATAEGAHRAAGLIGVLRPDASFELINVAQVVSVSVGTHPKVQDEIDERMAAAKKFIERVDK